MSVDAAEPDDEEPRDDDHLADDDTPVEDITPEQKKGSGRPEGMTNLTSRKLSEQMWEEYAGGLTMQQIGDLHGLTRASVSRRLSSLRLRLGLEDITAAKALDLGRYEALIEKVWRQAFNDTTPENVRTLAMLMDQRAKLLGLNAPRKLQVDGQVSVGLAPELIAEMRRIREEHSLLPSARITRKEIEAGDEDEVLDAELLDEPD